MRRPKALLSSILKVVLAGLYFLIVIGPMLALLVGLRAVPASDWGRLVLPTERQLRLWLRSIGLAASVSIAAMGLGVLIALMLQRWEARLANLRWAVVLLAPLPSMTHAMAWSWLMNTLNRTLARVGLRPLAFQGWLAAWWIQMLWLAPIAIGLALIALDSIDRELIEAARLLQPDIRTLKRVMLPLAAPLLLAGGGLIFLLSLVDYTIPSLCQVNVTALDIFADFSVHNQPGRALLVSMPLLATTTVVLILSQAQLRPLALDPNWHRADSGLSYHWHAGFRIFLYVALVVMALAVSVPAISLVAQVDGFRELTLTLSEARAEIAFSLLIGLLSAALSLPIAFAAARGALSSGPSRRVWWLAITVPMALPGPLVGIGLITLWNQPGWGGLGIYGSRWMPVLAALARYTPLGALVLIAGMRRINSRLLDAARMLETSRLRTWLLVRLPLLAPGLLASAGLVFCLTLSELSATLLVAPPGQSTLTLRLYNYLHYGASETVAGFTLVLTGLVLAFALLAAIALALWTRLTTVSQAKESRP